MCVVYVGVIGEGNFFGWCEYVYVVVGVGCGGW